ncbi:hypothetical protein OCU04_005381 [Sclerotinia nivalis]|uniref:Uncharacterized protein n=1 Tax=Sclerotinia nivalis TaxID=352851 RepID=A0A9X0DLR8_9HELO|nr:hypothetical protein OCU04_005381 [Sclerotinia nivalis]
MHATITMHLSITPLISLILTLTLLTLTPNPFVSAVCDTTCNSALVRTNQQQGVGKLRRALGMRVVGSRDMDVGIVVPVRDDDDALGVVGEKGEELVDGLKRRKDQK